MYSCGIAVEVNALRRALTPGAATAPAFSEAQLPDWQHLQYRTQHPDTAFNASL